MKKPSRILALTGVILILAMYASTLIFALMDSPSAKGLFMASVFCTIVVPVFLYAMIQTARILRGRGAGEEAASEEKAPEDLPEGSGARAPSADGCGPQDAGEGAAGEDEAGDRPAGL